MADERLQLSLIGLNRAMQLHDCNSTRTLKMKQSESGNGKVTFWECKNRMPLLLRDAVDFCVGREYVLDL